MDTLTVVPKEFQLLIKDIPASDIVGIATFLVLVVTLFISLKALREAGRANTLSFLPVVVMGYEESKVNSKETESRVIVRNIGHGAALDVKVDTYYQSFIDDLTPLQKAQHVVVRFKRVDLLQPGNMRPVKITKNETFLDADTIIFNLFHSEGSLIFHLRYSDISGVRYISKVKISERYVEVLGTPKKLNLLRKIGRLCFLLLHALRVIAERLHAKYQQHQHNKKKAKKS